MGYVFQASLVCIVVLFTACRETTLAPYRSPWNETTVTGAELWNVNGHSYHVAGTVVVHYPSRLPLLVVRVERQGKNHGPLDVVGIARYAVTNGLIARAKKIGADAGFAALADSVGVDDVREVTAWHGFGRGRIGFMTEVSLDMVGAPDTVSTSRPEGSGRDR